MYCFCTVLADGVLEGPEDGGRPLGKPVEHFASFLQRSGRVQHDLLVDQTSEWIDVSFYHQVVKNFRRYILQAIEKALVMTPQPLEHPQLRRGRARARRDRDRHGVRAFRRSGRLGPFLGHVLSLFLSFSQSDQPPRNYAKHG